MSLAQIAWIKTVTSIFDPYGATIRDLVFVGTGSGSVLEVRAGDGAMSTEFTFTTNSATSLTGQSSHGMTVAKFTSVIYGVDLLNLSKAWLTDVIASGDNFSTRLTSLNTGYAGDAVDLIAMQPGAQGFVVSSGRAGDGLRVFGVGIGNSLTAVGAKIELGQVTGLASLTAGGESWLFAASTADDSIRAFTLSAAGALTQQQVLLPLDGPGVSDPTVIRTAEMGGRAFVIVAGAESGSVSVFELTSGGTLVARDHVIDDLNTRFAGTAVLEVAQVQGQTFVAAAGSDDGFTLFRLLADGRLVHMGTVADTSTTTLAKVSALTIGERDGAVHLFAASGSEAGLTHFSLAVSAGGQELFAASSGATVTGTGFDDVIHGGAGADTLRGMAGDDIIRDGAGADHLYGGAGSDLFILDYDGELDVIYDFEKGIDRLDLSNYPLIHDKSELTIMQTSWGARIIFQDEITEVHSSDGNSLSAADFTNAGLFNLSRASTYFLPGYVTGPDGGHSGNLNGTGGDDNLVGDAGNQILKGFGGNDVLNGRGGADALIGGTGNDTASYALSTGRLRIDLQYAHLNTGEAAGDTYNSIENIIGSEFRDNIRGDNGPNILWGGGQPDWLAGRGGNDILYGGVGDDVLMGGAGADVLDGGPNRDRAQYYLSNQGLVINLTDPSQNTGEAAGDTYISIEDLAGSHHNDIITGNAGANRLFGNKGNDVLYGLDGDDYLNGGAGSDTLIGGRGNDILQSGAGADVFVFAGTDFGADRITDFRAAADRVHLDVAVLSGPMTTQQMLDSYGSIVNGHAFLDFGGGQSITFDGISDLALLTDVFDFI